MATLWVSLTFLHANKGADPPAHVHSLIAPLLFTYWKAQCLNFMQNFNILSSLCSWAGWFESYSVGNPEGRPSNVKALIYVYFKAFIKVYYSKSCLKQPLKIRQNKDLNDKY